MEGYESTGVLIFGGLGIFFVGGGTLVPKTFLTAGGGTGFLACSTIGNWIYA